MTEDNIITLISVVLIQYKTAEKDDLATMRLNNCKKYIFVCSSIIISFIFGCTEDSVSDGNAGDSSCPVGACKLGNMCISTDLNRDYQNCGKCGIKCLDDEICYHGTCQKIDPCQNIDLNTNHQNCGFCGYACKDNETCINGNCQINTICKGSNLKNDPKNCGKCGFSCQKDEFCDKGICLKKNPCEGINLKNDSKNCGVCGHECGDNKACVNGICRKNVHCKDIDLTSDSQNCGECGHVCNDGETCIQGVCKKGDDCEGIDLSSDTQNCGECGHVCNDGETCIQGVCKETENELKPFSIIIVPDTQHYTRTENGIYEKEMAWIAQHKESDNIKMVFHLGDLTQSNTADNWQKASRAHAILDEAKVPYVLSTGNHDYNASSETTDLSNFGRNKTQLNQYFNAERFKNESWFGEFFEGPNMYGTFSVGNLKFLAMAIEFEPRKDVLCKAEEIIRNHPDHYVIVSTHGLLSQGASSSPNKYLTNFPSKWLTFGATGSEIYDELTARHSNIIMSFSGHVCGSEHRMKTGYSGNPLFEILTDFQCEKPCKDASCLTNSCTETLDSGNGWIQKMTINPMPEKDESGQYKNNILVETFTVLDNNYFYNNEPQMMCSDVSASNYYDRYPTGSTLKYETFIDFSQKLTYQYDTRKHTAFGIRNVGENSEGQQSHPSISVNKKSSWSVATWQHDEGDVHEVRARVFCAGGCSMTDEFTVAAVSNGEPQVVTDEKDNIFIAWVEKNDNNSSIWLRAFSQEGKETLPKTRLVSSRASDLPYSIAMNNSGTLAIAYSEEEMIYTATFSTADNKVIPILPVSSIRVDNSNQYSEPAIEIMNNGTFIVSYIKTTSQNNTSNVLLNVYNSDGTEKVSDKQLNINEAAEHHSPAIAVNDSGQIYVAFEETESANVTSIHLAGIQASGTQIYEDIAISATDTANRTPSICIDAASKKLVATWTEVSGTESDVRQRYLEKGTLSSLYYVSHDQTGIQRNSVVSCSEAGKFVYLFEDDNDKDNNFEIFAHGY